jgi:hypothetical protein
MATWLSYSKWRPNWTTSPSTLLGVQHMVTKDLKAWPVSNFIQFRIQKFRLCYAGSIGKVTDVSDESSDLLEDNAIFRNFGNYEPNETALTLKKAWICSSTLRVPRNLYFDSVHRRVPQCSSVLVEKLTVAQQSKCSLRITEHEVVGARRKGGAGGAAAPATRSARSGKMDGKWTF